MIEKLKAVKRREEVFKIDKFDEIDNFFQKMIVEKPDEMRAIVEKHDLTKKIKETMAEINKFEKDKMFYVNANKKLTAYFLQDGLIDDLIKMIEK